MQKGVKSTVFLGLWQRLPRAHTGEVRRCGHMGSQKGMARKLAFELSGIIQGKLDEKVKRV